jgi:Family of unknown function (DUF5706)
MENQKIEQLKYLINRYDHYYDSINNKGIFYLTFNSFVFGGLIISYKDMTESVNLNFHINLLVVLILFSSLLGLILTILSINPFKGLGTKKKSETYKSLIFFNSISDRKENDFKLHFKNQTEEELEDDFIKQTFELAAGLKLKFNMLSKAGYLITLEFLLFIPLLILIITNLK